MLVSSIGSLGVGGGVRFLQSDSIHLPKILHLRRWMVAIQAPSAPKPATINVEIERISTIYIYLEKNRIRSEIKTQRALPYLLIINY
jgi:hypothetical protein